MIQEMNLSDAKFVLSKDELGYKEVLDSFASASYIYILTFNVSENKMDLLNAIKKSSANDVCIVSNIPSRWDTYFSPFYNDVANRKIQIYKSKLDPSELGKNVSVCFCFSNHAKIIMTDKIAYVGSSNYSEESARNFEAGFISRDKKFIDFLHDEIFPWIIEESVDYNIDNDLLMLHTALQQSVSLSSELYENIHFCFYTYSGHSTTSDHQIYRAEDNEFSLKDIESINAFLDKYLSLLEKANGVFSHEKIKNRGIKNLDSVIERVEELYKMADELLTVKS